MARAFAPGKLILGGEHAVVYGQPAIALPVAAVGATATVLVEDRPASGPPQLLLDLPDLGERWSADEQPDHPLTRLAIRTLNQLGVRPDRSLTVVLESSIPIASGMGSGAALAAALVKALAKYAGHELDPASVSALVYESERYYHGTPSGIDNTVVSFARPIWYQRRGALAGAHIEPLVVGAPLTLVIGDTGLRCPTRVTVGRVREAAVAQPAVYEAHFESIGRIVAAARAALMHGDRAALGVLLDSNHQLLQTIGVSSQELDRLVVAARDAGALGAKLSGGGGGGVMLALVVDEAVVAVEAALLGAGAARVIVTRVPGTDAGAVLV